MVGGNRANGFFRVDRCAWDGDLYEICLTEELRRRLWGFDSEFETFISPPHCYNVQSQTEFGKKRSQETSQTFQKTRTFPNPKKPIKPVINRKLKNCRHFRYPRSPLDLLHNLSKKPFL